MRSSISESNILSACALVFLFYLVFLLLVNALLTEHVEAAIALFAISLIAEYRLLSAMLSNVYDKHFPFFRNALALFLCACCVFFALRVGAIGFTLAYTIFAGLPIATASTRRKRRSGSGQPRHVYK